jgi:hypothetical protein
MLLWRARLSATVKEVRRTSGFGASEKNKDQIFVLYVDFMVKLLRACVWMPWRKKAMKDVVSCDKLREAANRL